MTVRLRVLLLASAAPVLALAAPAGAVDITADRNTPIETDDVDNGNPGDVNINSGVTVSLENGTVVTVNSNNTLTNSGTITISDADDAVGVRVLGGFTGRIDNRGTIRIDEDFTRQDQDDDGTPDGPFAQGARRTGILIEGAAPFTGDIRNAGEISIEGNDSRGIDLQTTLAGSVIQQGRITVTGDRGVGIDVGGPVSGDVRLHGAVGVVGEGSSAVVVAGDVGGNVTVGGAITATGFAFQQCTNYNNILDCGPFTRKLDPSPLDADDLKRGGPAFVVAGNVAHGVLIDGPVGGGNLDDPEEGEDPTKDIKGDFDVNRSVGTITSIGSAPAVLISPDLSAAATGDLVIGLVVENVRDTRDDDDDDDREEVIATFLEEHGFINRGSISANGLNVNFDDPTNPFDANAIVIEGAPGRNTIIEGGVLNAGTIQAAAVEASATAVRFGAGAQTPRFDNAQTITSFSATEGNHNVTVLLIEAGSMVQALNNSGTLTATARGDGANVVALRDLSGTLVSIDNTGTIAAFYAPDFDDDDGDGDATDIDEQGRAVAIDLSAHQAGQNVAIVQAHRTPTADNNEDGVIDNKDVPAPQIVGAVLLGAGDDTVELLGGSMTGDLELGAGADTLTLGGGTVFVGGLTDSDGRANVTVGDAELLLNKPGDIRVSSLTLGDGSTTGFAVDLRPGSEAHSRFIASGGIVLTGGAAITPEFLGLGSLEPQTIELLRAEGGVTLADGQTIASNLAVDTPFLFEVTLLEGTDGSAETVDAVIRRRSADELGMSPNQAAAYEPIAAALNSDLAALQAIVNLDSPDEFFQAYNQLLPEFSLAVLQHTLSSIDGGVGAVGNRLDAVRAGRSGAGAAWVQEYALYVDRAAGLNDPGYRGNGFGIATGIDRPLWPFYAVGVNIAGSASEMEQPGGFDAPLSITSAQVGAYAAAAAGNLLFDLYAGAGVDYFDSERRVEIGDVSRTIMGDWRGQHYSASARLGYDFRMRRMFARPALSVDYLRLDEYAYLEEGSLGLLVDDRTSEMLASTASLTVGAQFGDPRLTWWSPRLRVGYRYENMGHTPITTAKFLAGGDPFFLRAEDLPEAGALIGFTLAAGSRYSSFALDYDGDLRDGFNRHGLRLTFRFIF